MKAKRNVDMQEYERLLRQSAIISTMMLTLSRLMGRDYQRKHVGVTFSEWLMAFVAWRDDKPMSVNGMRKVAGLPEGTARRAATVLEQKKIISKADRRGRYVRNTDYIVARLGSTYFRQIRLAIIKAADELREVYPDD